MRRTTLVVLVVAVGVMAFATSSAQAQTPAPQPGVYGAPPAQDPSQTPVQNPNRGQFGGGTWKRIKCGAAIAWVVGSSVFAISKIVKIKGAIKSLGGVKKTAKLLAGKSKGKQMDALAKAGTNAAAYFLGIDTIESQC